ncbi:MAG TPA: hypothetical protein VJ044_13085, partial [Candidatus Hodarchaeales archaeon]|nr:hypothetical protein [Candidatus Hodarchaeales archaeon]
MKQNEEVIFSSFDNHRGQIPIYSSLFPELSTAICQQIVMSLMTAVNIGKRSSNAIEGESVIPLPEFDYFCVVYYFYLTVPELSEPSFSFIAYLIPFESRKIAYANILALRDVLAAVTVEIRRHFHPKNNMGDSLLPKELLLLLKDLRTPLISLLKARYRDDGENASGAKFFPEPGFIHGVAYALLGKNGQVQVEVSEGISQELVRKISMRFILSLPKAEKSITYSGEGIV